MTASIFARIKYSDFTDRMNQLYPASIAPNKGITLAQNKIRQLSPIEITQLNSQGNWAQDWSTVLVSHDFVADRIRNCSFFGYCLLASFNGPEIKTPDGSIYLPGIYSSTLRDCQIGKDAAIHRCDLLQNYVIASNVVCASSSLIAGHELNSFGNGSWIDVGIETGGRSSPIFADISLDMAEHILLNPGDKEIIKLAQDFVENYVSKISRCFGVVDEGAMVTNCQKIVDSYIGPCAQLNGATLIEKTSIISTCDDPCLVGSASIIKKSIIQEGASILDGAIVENSMLFEHSHASQHGKVVQCLVGPNSGVSKGEATSSFLGPFVGFHHQGLLIAALWPRGRGNIGYGANVGSNHTSRVPDQEFWPGEGTFFGLGCTIKYPSNFKEAPYTIVAAGVTTLPQKISYPFSLINEPIGYYLEVPPGYNNLIPAWCLTENLYMLQRNEGKYIARNKAKRNVFELDVFRPEILDYMREAIRNLRDIEERKTIYLPGDLPGIGKNMLTDENRLKAIEAYHFFIDLATFRKDKTAILELRDAKAGETLDDPERRRLIGHMSRLKEMLPSLVQKVETSRSRDFERGAAIIDDYHKTHGAVKDDTFVKQTKKEIKAELSQVQEALRFLQQA